MFKSFGHFNDLWLFCFSGYWEGGWLITHRNKNSFKKLDYLLRIGKTEVEGEGLILISFTCVGLFNMSIFNAGQIKMSHENGPLSLR